MKTALVLIDLQHDFLQGEGRMPIARDQVQPLLDATHELTARARAAGIPVAHVVNAYPKRSLLNLFRKFAAIEGSPGARIDPRCPQPGPAEPVFQKSASDAFHRPQLRAWLARSGIERVVLGGVYANACVRATARGAADAGLRVAVVREAVAAGSEPSRQRGLSKIEDYGGRIVSVEQLDAQLADTREELAA